MNKDEYETTLVKLAVESLDRAYNKHPLLGKVVRVFTIDETRMEYFEEGDATLIHVCDSHIVVRVDCCGNENNFLEIHPWNKIVSIDTVGMGDDDET